ncbi:MAG: hypothetical protein K0S16_877 [Moraxellaceae bacterium]|nr:hypothetical protein [Moraxellaceae bacterium]
MRAAVHNWLSLAMAVLGGIALMLAIAELPHYDPVSGRYITALMARTQPGHDTGMAMSSMPLLSMTERRIVSSLFLGGIAACCLALLSGVMAMRKGGAATLYALSITLSLALLFTAFQFRWIFAW